MGFSDSPTAFKALYAAMHGAARFSESLSGRIGARIWFTPWRVELPNRAKQKQASWLERTEPVAIETSDGTVGGFAAGEGPTTLLVHGWGDRAASMGAFIEPLTSAGHKVVGIDLPGHGASAAIDPNVYSMARAIREVAGTVGATSVLAHSLGAMATMVALRDGLEVNRVLLISPSSCVDHIVEQFSTMLSMPERAERGLRRNLEKRFGPGVWEDLSVPGLVRGVTTQALIIHDRDDDQVPHQDSVDLVDAWPAASLVSTESLGHTRTLRSEEVLHVAVSFLAEPDRLELEPRATV